MITWPSPAHGGHPLIVKRQTVTCPSAWGNSESQASVDS
jgi:hypothetical protein